MSKSRRTTRADGRSRSRQPSRQAAGPTSRQAAGPTTRQAAGLTTNAAPTGRRPAARPARAGASARRWIVVGLVVVAAAAVIAILVRGMPAETAGAPSAPPISAGPASTASLAPGGTASDLVQGAALPAFSDAANDPAVGQRIPTITGSGFDGQDVTIRPDDGRPKIIVFLTHWCSHCQAEVPRIQEWLDGGGGPSTVDLYAVSTFATPERPNYPPDAWLAREGWTVPTAVDDGASSIARAYGLNAFPYWAFVGADGTVARRASGELSIEQIEQAITGLAG